MSTYRAAIAVGVGVVAAAILVSGSSSSDPQTPRALPGQPPPFLGTVLAGSGRLTAAIDSYGDVVDLRPDGPAGPASFAVSSARQAAETVPRDTGLVPRAGAGPGPPLPLWRADWVRQSYLPGTNVVSTTASIAGARVRILDAVPSPGNSLVRVVSVVAEGRGSLHLQIGGSGTGPGCHGGQWSAPSHLRIRLVCSPAQPFAGGTASLAGTVRSDRRWLAKARQLGVDAPSWARRMYARSLLILRALTDSRSGAVAAGARDGWAYVWPRDAGAVAIALAATGYQREARRVARFLTRLDPDAAARYAGDGAPVGGRAAAGDATGWIHAAASATGFYVPPPRAGNWQGRGDYGERSDERGDYLANAIADGVPAARIRALFGSGPHLLRQAGDPGSGIDSAVAWAVRPFPRPSLFPQVGASLRRLLRAPHRFGIQPTEQWPGADPWTAPTAWTAWSLAALGEKGRALSMIAALRRAATPAGTLPERVDATSGIPRSTTPLAWSHAFTALALQQLWPPS